MTESQVEKFVQLFHGVFWSGNRVTNGAWITVDLPVVATLECLVAEEVDVLVMDA